MGKFSVKPNVKDFSRIGRPCAWWVSEKRECGVFQACLLMSITFYGKTDPVQFSHYASAESRSKKVDTMLKTSQLLGEQGQNWNLSPGSQSRAVPTLPPRQLIKSAGACLNRKEQQSYEQISDRLVVGIRNLMGKSNETEVILHSSSA